MVRLKVKCKNPSRIPLERVLEIQDELFLLTYKVEGYKQKQRSEGKDGGDEDGDDPDTDDEDDLLKDELDDLKKKIQTPRSRDKEESRGGDHTPQQGNKGQGDKQDHQSKAKEAIATAMKSVLGMTERGEIQEEPNKNFCINLLKAMELDDKESEDELEESTQDNTADQEMMALPDEWVYVHHNQRR
jgi:hypothetical protein